MAMSITIALVLVQLVVGSLGVESDIRCLKAIKSSFEDPHGYLKSSWNFDNKTEGFICKFVGVECWHPDENKVLNLRLNDMGLSGHFPTGIQYCTSLTGLDLSRNSISGTIPAEIHNLMPFVTFLDLSYNTFSGKIPRNIANCSYLNVLKLDHNRLTGTVPAELGQMERLKTFSVAHNLLSGNIPPFPGKSFIKQDSFADNPELCGAPLESCVPTDPFKIAFGIGFVFSFLVAVFISSPAASARARNIARTMALSVMKTKQHVHLPISENILIEIPGMEQLVHKISFAQLCTAAQNFKNNNVIGIGKAGTMYKAALHTGQFVAVKKLHDSEAFESQFVSELLALGRLKHNNIVPLLGFCIERNKRLLVYKYMPNGSLHDWLHGSAKILQWPTRLKIAIGAARVLSWLHHACDFRVVHRDISSKCVLLDHHFEPKISNFGKAIISNHGGEMAEYTYEDDSVMLESGEERKSDFTKKDVYDYGIVLLEMLISNQRMQASSSLGNPLVAQDDIDKSLTGQGFEGEIMEVLRIAYECVHTVPNQRPTMLQVYTRIRCIGERDEIIHCDTSQ